MRISIRASDTRDALGATRRMTGSHSGSPVAQFRRRFARNTSARVGAAIITLFVALAIVAPLLRPYAPLEISLTERLQPPGPRHWLGTDPLGRDVLSRLLEATRLSLSVGIIIGVTAVLVGVPLGVFAGFKGGIVDE